MNDQKAKELLDKIIAQIFGFANPFSLEQFKSKYAFDVRLPAEVSDSVTGEPTWASSTNPLKFMMMKNAYSRGDFLKDDNFTNYEDWTLKKRPLNTIEDVLNTWEIVNYTATERELDSINVYRSDNVSESENVYHSMDVIKSKNVIFCDGAIGCENVVATQRSNTVNYSARVEDCSIVNDSFSVSWSGKINKSMFIHDCYDMYESLFCSHLKSRKFCIANIQFEEKEYYKIKEMIVRWILTTD